jgi:hypothetical protein
MKEMVRAALRKAGLQVKRIPVRDELKYLSGGRIPWSHGYRQAKERFICQVVADPGLLYLFKNAGKLPEQYGVGFDERCVEYPWLLSLICNPDLNVFWMLGPP